MTKNEKRVLDLAKTLPNREDIINEEKYKLIDNNYYDQHHCGDYLISECCEEYQVIRMYDVEISPHDPLDNLTPEQQQEYENNYDEFIDKYQESLEFAAEEDYDNTYYEFETGEYLQRWINTTTGEIVILGKINDDDANYCDFNKTYWEVVSGEDKDERCRKFIDRFGNSWSEGFYRDLSVHPSLLAKHYQPIDTTAWYIECGEDENKTNEARFFLHVGDWCKFMVDCLNNTTPYEVPLKLYGLDEIVYANTIGDKAQDYYTALKIAKRNHYTPTDIEMWRKMVLNLIELHKDIHNSFYVCPADLHKAFDKWDKQLKKHKDEIVYRDNLVAAKKANEDYVSRMSKYLNICLQSVGGIIITPLQSVPDFLAEGAAMHHCVYSMGYYKRDNCLIFSAHRANGERLATVEFNLNTMQIVQCRAECNMISPFEYEIRTTIMEHVKDIRKIKNNKSHKNAA